MDIKNKIIAITGASSGLGRALAVALARQGAKLSLHARNKERLQQTAQLCQAAAKGVGGMDMQPQTTTGDIRNPEECNQWITATINHHGRIDALINNAGISMRTPIRGIANLADYRPIMDTTFWGAAQCTHAALPHLRQSGGMIVNISSVQGKVAIPQHSVYAASKHAMEGFFMSLSMEEPTIKILTIRPGWIDNTRINQNRIINRHSRPPRHSRESGNPTINHQTPEGVCVDYCAKKIITAIKQNKETLTIPAKYKYLPTLTELFPQTTKKAITQKTKTRYS